MIQYLGESKLKEEMIQRGIPLAQKILIEEASQAGHEGSPEYLLSVGIQERINRDGNENLMRFVNSLGNQNFKAEHNEEKYIRAGFGYGKKELEHLQYILTGFLQIDPDKRLTAEGVLSYYLGLDLDLREGSVLEFLEIGVLVSTPSEGGTTLSQGPQKRMRYSNKLASTVGSTSSDSSAGRPTPSPK